MGRRLILLGVLSMGARMEGAQAIALAASAIPGVQILSSQSAEYAAAVDRIVPPPRSEALNAWLPYGIVLKNGTTQVIRGVAARWVLTAPNGSPFSYLGRLEASHVELPPGGIALLLSSLGQLRTANDNRPLPRKFRLTPSPDTDGRPDINLDHYRTAQAVEGNLDGVVFASGQFVGPDTGHEFEQWVADDTVPPQVASKALAMQAGGESTASIVAWLETVKQSESADDWTAQVTGRTARQLLQVYQSKGEEGFYRYAQSRSQPPTLRLYR